jgi:hypothetical protein
LKLEAIVGEDEWRFCPETNHQYRNRVELSCDRNDEGVRTGRGGYGGGEFPVRKFSTRKWSGGGQEMGSIIWSHLFDTLFYRISRESWEVTGCILPCWATAESGSVVT